MSDYISRKTAIELLHYNADERCSAVVSDFEEIPAADVEPVRRRIPCSERLPESDNVWEQYNVLLCTYRPAWYGDDEYAEEKYVLPAEYNHEQKVWRVSGSGEIINALIEEKSPWRSYISHWMPLPEPPEEENDEPIDGLSTGKILIRGNAAGRITIVCALAISRVGVEMAA